MMAAMWTQKGRAAEWFEHRYQQILLVSSFLSNDVQLCSVPKLYKKGRLVFLAGIDFIDYLRVVMESL